MAARPIRRTAMLVLAGAVAVGAVFGAGAVAESGWAGRSREATPVLRQPPSSPVQQRVLVYGDSLVVQSTPYLPLVGRALGLSVASRAFPGTAPCDFLPALRQDLAERNVDVIVWAFIGNTTAPCMLDSTGHPLAGAALLAKYRLDTQAAIDAATKAGVPFVLASPPAPDNPGNIWPQLDAVYRELAAGKPRIGFADAGVNISPDGRFVTTLRCLPFELSLPQARQACATSEALVTVRGADGVHFCSVTNGIVCEGYASGAMRYAMNLLGAARLELDARERR